MRLEQKGHGLMMVIKPNMNAVRMGIVELCKSVSNIVFLMKFYKNSCKGTIFVLILQIYYGKNEWNIRCAVVALDDGSDGFGWL